MTLFGHEISHSECLDAGPANDAGQSPFFRLPYELRRMIFWRSIDVSRSPSPKQVHETNLRVTWKDRPSPLLSTSRRTRDEVKDLLRNHQLFTLRVTTFGVAFDMLSLSCFIAQGLRPKNYHGLSALQVEIWPPHERHSRRIEMLYLHEHLQKLRDKLRTGPQIRQLSVCLLENQLVRWSRDGEPKQRLAEFDWSNRDDIELVLDHFAYVTNVDKASVQLPQSLHGNKNVKQHASIVTERMENGVLKDDEDIYSEVTDAILENPFGRFDAPHVEKIFLDELYVYRTEGIDYTRMYRVWYGNLDNDSRDYTKVEDFTRVDGLSENTESSRRRKARREWMRRVGWGDG